MNRKFSDILLGNKEANVDSLINYVCTKFELNDERIDGIRDKLSLFYLHSKKEERQHFIETKYMKKIIQLGYNPILLQICEP